MRPGFWTEEHLTEICVAVATALACDMANMPVSGSKRRVTTSANVVVTAVNVALPERFLHVVALDGDAAAADLLALASLVADVLGSEARLTRTDGARVAFKLDVSPAGERELQQRMRRLARGPEASALAATYLTVH